MHGHQARLEGLGEAARGGVAHRRGQGAERDHVGVDGVDQTGQATPQAGGQVLAQPTHGGRGRGASEHARRGSCADPAGGGSPRRRATSRGSNGNPQQPRAPHGHSRAGSPMGRCPNSPCRPRAPGTGWPSTTTAPPSPTSTHDVQQDRWTSGMGPRLGDSGHGGVVATQDRDVRAGTDACQVDVSPAEHGGLQEPGTADLSRHGHADAHDPTGQPSGGRWSPACGAAPATGPGPRRGRPAASMRHLAVERAEPQAASPRGAGRRPARPEPPGVPAARRRTPRSLRGDGALDDQPWPPAAWTRGRRHLRCPSPSRSPSSRG